MALQSFYDREMFDYKIFAIKAAKDLRYPKSVIRELKNAKDEEEISRIMKIARERDIHEENGYLQETEKLNRIRGKRRGTKYGTVKVRCLNNQKVYNSIKEAADELGLRQALIAMCCKGERKSHGGMRFEYIEREEKL